MIKLSNLPNIGKVVEAKLKEVGINYAEELIALGSKEDFTRLRIIDSGACFSMLCGLEGAVQGIRWHNLSKKDKNELEVFFVTLQEKKVRKKANVKVTARKCYGHIGGELGERIFKRLIELEWLKLEAGKSTVYEVTEKGYEEFNKLGVNVN